MFRFIHAADLHLDSPLKGLSSYPGAPVETLRLATRRALENLVDEALERRVDLLLVAGDVYDGDWPDYHTGLFFVSQMARLKAAGIQVVVISGNHDAESRITRSLELPDNVKVLSTDQPETFELTNHRVAIHGQGFKERVVEEDLSKRYPPPLKGFFNIGLLHTSADGREGHAPYAPCSVSFLRDHGYDYWALGHIHQREVLSENPWIVFSGNLQGRHARETGAKGASLVTVEHGRVVEVEHLPCDEVRWAALEVNIASANQVSDALNLVRAELSSALDSAEGRLLAVRVTTTGASPVHWDLSKDPEKFRNQVQALALEIDPQRLWVEKVKLLSQARVDFEQLAQTDPFFAALQIQLQTLQEQPEELQALGAELFQKLEQKLPRPWREGDEAILPTGSEELEYALSEVGSLLTARLSELGEVGS